MQHNRKKQLILQPKSEQSIIRQKSRQVSEVLNGEYGMEHKIIKSTSSLPLIAVFIVSFFSFLLSLYFILFIKETVDTWPQLLFLVFIIWSTVYLIATKKAKNTYFLISTAIIFTLSIFHLSHIGLQAIGLYNFPSFIDKEMGFWYQSAGWLVMLALSSFGMGLSLTGGTVIYNNKSLINSSSAILGRSLCWWYGVGLFLTSMLSLLLLFYTVGNIFIYSRSQIFGGIGDTRGFGLFQILFPSSIILLMLGATTKLQRYATYAIAILFGCGILLMGYRSLVMFPFMIGLILWVKAGRGLNKSVIISVSLILIVAIPAVRYFRQLGSYDTLTSADLGHSIKQAKIEDIFVELGGTSNIVAYVMKWVPAQENYRYGYTYWLAIKNIIPNIGFNISSSTRSIVKNNGSNIADLSASDWFTYRYNKWAFRTGGGEGFSMVAEPYLNFGVLGVVVFFMLLGYIIGRLDNVSLLRHPLVLLISAAIIWPLIKAVRNDFSTFTKPASFILIILLIWKLVTFWKRYRAVKLQDKTKG